ncbi:YchJ family protein [Lacisediminihabitans changchengi]|uniref:YchJ family protein n=1 Tax=Lacisediminihabitans changchengi TaxID=2787634 RepID=UPI0027DAE0CF|nr:YchJ family protein [Lacisediminihabitans changchengi]
MLPSPSSLSATARCPCLSGNVYGDCCGPIHRGDAVAPTAERLMRSRFSAFALGLPQYLLDSWHPSTRPATLDLDDGLRWQLLEILRTVNGGPFDTVGTVEFRATYRAGGERGELRETSTFTRDGKRWFYVDGVID